MVHVFRLRRHFPHFQMSFSFNPDWCETASCQCTRYSIDHECIMAYSLNKSHFDVKLYNNSTSLLHTWLLKWLYICTGL